MGHVNNVTYVRYAESARVNWTRNIGMHIDAANREKWFNLLNSRGIGLILRSIKVDYKFVSQSTIHALFQTARLTIPFHSR